MPKKTVEIIVNSGNDYLIEVKGNQKKLLQKAQQIVLDNEPLASYSTEEKNRGRLECRDHHIYELPKPIQTWKSVQRIIHIHRYGHRPNKKTDNGYYDEHHYYISSCKFDDAKQVAIGVRQHWGIENKIHYVKDTHFNEDANGIRHNHAAAILSIFQDIAINLYRCLGYPSLKTATIIFANKINELFELLNSNHIKNL